MATIKELGDGGPDGTRLGLTSSELIGFYGATPSARLSTVATALDTTAITPAFTTTVTGTFGFVTSAQGTAVMAAVASLVTNQAAITATVNTIRAQLVALGLVKGA